MKRVKDCLRNFKKKCSVFSWEKNGMDNLKSHIASLDAFLVEKIQEAKICEEQVHKIERTIRIRRIRAIFGLFSVNNKKVKDFEETLFDRLFSVVLVIRIVLSRFSVRF